jgi:hypothetical protein
MVLDVALLLCPFTAVSDIFTIGKDFARQHCNNAEFNVLDNASLAIY